ncbi:glyoxylase-like metal-dependent hydrolase (beta-lactamase superfamily II) [Ulvibacter sp. MAR_2010_11]|uniref:MBL fold metallo-hydrolase n=1 Tax=Ulvibacter sp. MAR_2010_11 TaxID=1250229 RepID=UPI000C2C6972|nr:MBL fold metallo-hydrolase [Ulvibacter sp. MAR_2010_11]PKA83262.1 glyoxylase-like metal-dependent hydrolase (beta-lactamase superfamily II) [Ulvibacter sp. MAR_2010_11]
MHYKIIVSLIAFFSLFSVLAQKTDGGDKVQFKMINVNKDIYMLQGKGGNIGLSFGHDGVFMIDDQFADLSEDILKEIAKVDKKPIQFLINTHMHGDHTGGNANMVEAGAIIVAQDNVRTRLQETIIKAEDKARGDTKILPTITFAQDMTFYFNGEKIMIFHVHDAHTDGDAVVYFTQSNVIHTGDVFFKDRYPYIDLNNGGTVQGYMAALEKIALLADDDTKIIPGHGDIGTKKDLEAMASMLGNIYRRVTHHYTNHKTKAEIIAMRDFTKPFDDLGFGNGFISTEKMLEIMYDDVEKIKGKIDKRNMEERLQEELMKQQENKGGKGE